MKNLHAKMAKIVEGYLTNYKDDFYIHDTKRLETLKSGIWSMRPTGTDMTDTDKIYVSEFYPRHKSIDISAEIRNVTMWHERNQRFFEIKNGDLKEITKEKAISILAQKARQELSRKLEILEKESKEEYEF